MNKAISSARGKSAVRLFRLDAAPREFTSLSSRPGPTFVTNLLLNTDGRTSARLHVDFGEVGETVRLRPYPDLACFDKRLVANLHQARAVE